MIIKKKPIPLLFLIVDFEFIVISSRRIVSEALKISGTHHFKLRTTVHGSS